VVPSSQVCYSVAIGPCVNTKCTTLFASQFYPAGFSTTINPLCYNSPTVNLMGIVQATTNGYWDQSTPGISGSMFNPGANLQTGVYTLTYATVSAPNANLCPDKRTIDVFVSNPPQPQISNVGPLCSTNADVQMTVTPSTGFWTNSAYLSNSGVFSPSLASVGNNPVQYLIGTNVCNRQQTKFVSIEAFVPAKITSPLPDQCTTGSPVSLVPLTLSSNGLWSGPGISGTVFNPALTGSGTFTIVHSTASSPSGLCPDQDAIAVNVYSLATPEIIHAGPFCTNSLPIQLQVTPVGGFFAGANIGAVSLEGKFSPGSAIIGDNLVNYSITSGPCIAYAQATIQVEQFVSAAFDHSVSAICLVPGKTAQINMNTYVVNPGGSWSGDGIVANTSMFDPYAAKEKNNVITYYTHSSPHFNLCPDQKSITVDVRKVKEMKAIVNAPTGCAPAEFIFNTPSIDETTPGTPVWTFDDGSAPTTGGVQVSHVFTEPGIYHATLSFRDEIGCESIPAKSSEVRVLEKPKADFTFPDEIYISNPEVQMTNLTTVLGNNTYQWKAGNKIYDDVNPVIPFSKIGKYQVTLIATGASSYGNCADEITKTIEVKNDFNIFIPTSFSPNFDGLNDIFIPVFTEYGLDNKSFEMEIFDRWGHSLYRTKDVTKGWDGSVQNKGEPLKEEVYIYRIKFKDLDGNSYSKMGHLSLIK
jgi:gliding motility-associated-like protein